MYRIMYFKHVLGLLVYPMPKFLLFIFPTFNLIYCRTDIQSFVYQLFVLMYITSKL